jgi:hypothetical protein
MIFGTFWSLFPKLVWSHLFQNTLVISALDRSFHNSNFECRAINNNVTDPPK